MLMNSVLDRTVLAIFSTAFLIPFTFSAQAASVILNGGFETYTGGSVFQASSAGSLPSQIDNTGAGGYTQLANWTIGTTSGGTTPLILLMDPTTASTTGSRDILFNDNFILYGPGNGNNNGLTASPSGGLFVAVDGDSTLSAPISQTVNNLIVGITYEVAFYWAGAQQNGFVGGTTERWQVSFGGVTQSTPVLGIPQGGFTGWQRQTFNYIAQSTTQTLSFLAIGTPNGQPPFSLLDGVSIREVPEPLTFLGLGIATGLGTFFKRKQAKQKKLNV